MGLVCAVLAICMCVLVGTMVISWFPLQPGTTLAGLAHVLRLVTDPVLDPVRRVVRPFQVAGLALDVSPLVVLVVLGVVQWAICS